MPSLNQIFFGPPGTGKTYATIEATLEILDPAYLAAHQGQRTALKKRFDELAESGDVHFVTFHQSFSYEDFVEGLRAESDDYGQLRYAVVPGIFKRLCSQQLEAPGPFKIGDKYGTGYKVLRSTSDVVELEKPQGKYLPIGMSLLNDLADHVKAGTFTVDDLRNGEWDKKAVGSTLEPFLVNGYKNLIPSLVAHIVSAAGHDVDQLSFEPSSTSSNSAKVLIIDEINRGNISRIFGELITLIEPSKRAGASEALEVILPYSKKCFSVPNNVYLIGTMNTADRSLAALDIALRRRFTFTEVAPNPELLHNVTVEGIAIDRLLDVMNQRIAVLLDRDHCLGHAYFMPLKSEPTLERLEDIFRQQILPLLQEYFFDDWQRIQWVLNDQRKAVENRFLLQPNQDLSALFGDSVVINQRNERWELNVEAFGLVEAYLGIIDHTSQILQPLVVREASEDGVTVQLLASGSIVVLRDGARVSPVLPVLREFAEKYNISVEFGSGSKLNTRHLGRRVIKALDERKR
ncbi:ATPase [Pseudomonas cichorii]|nr:AAA family ATPase [Pseudomonas cichorii]GFM51102.1 ATPase [Pseudomonas cichorii]